MRTRREVDPRALNLKVDILPQDLERYIVLWGPGILILIVFAYGFMKLAYHWIDRTMDMKHRQMDSAFDIARDYVGQLSGASRTQAEALSRLASAVEHRDSLESYEHQEMLIALKALHRDVEDLTSQVRTPAKVSS
ncbi:MAG TPA: hypothetical protein VMT20_19530 [Terriglobia bacterium]|nr:hypothetical protein [Terriglobia bacterium]